MTGPSGGLATLVVDGDGERPSPWTTPNRLRAVAVKSSRRQTSARADGRPGRSARCGGGGPDSAGGSRVLPRAFKLKC